MNTIPPHLLASLHRGHVEPDIWRLVTQLELYGVAVTVQRLQLGDTTLPGFGRAKIIYQTKEIQEDGRDATG
jgi:hypothetical protein